MDKMRELTLGVRQNQQEVGDFLRDLDSWTSNIKKQDQNLKTMKPRENAISSMPPVRTKLITEKVKNKRESEKAMAKQERIKSADYRKWERLDVDKMCKEIDDEEADAEAEVQIEVEKLDQDRKQKVAIEMKEKGNEHFKNKGYNAAIECYTTGMQADPSNPVFPANRAMAYLLLKKYSEAETDCTLALSLDPSYVKAYLRRGTARVSLGKTTSGKRDFTDALKLEPSNPQAKAELKKINDRELGSKAPKPIKNRDKPQKSQHVYPVLIPLKDRSKKPLMRVEVEEIGFEDEGITNIDLQSKSNSFVAAEAVNDARITGDQLNSVISNGFHSNDRKKLIEEVDVVNSMSKAISNSSKVVNSKDISACKASKTVPNGRNFKPVLKDGLLLIPSCPTTSFQFQAHVKSLSDDSVNLYRYLLQISPEKIPSLLKQQIETETLIPIIKCLKSSDDNDLVFRYVLQFSNTRRFDMAVMFMSEDEQAEVQKLFSILRDSLPHRISELDLISKKYGL